MLLLLFVAAVAVAVAAVAVAAVLQFSQPPSYIETRTNYWTHVCMYIMLVPLPQRILNLKSFVFHHPIYQHSHLVVFK